MKINEMILELRNIFPKADKTSLLSEFSQFEYNNLIIHMLHKENDVIVTDKHWVVLLFSENKQSKQIYKLLIEKYPELKN